MKQSNLLIPTIKETPNDAQIPSHQLMLRAGIMRKLASGLYTFLPLGIRVLDRIETIIREELNQSEAQEISMPILQPESIWQESGRWDAMGDELIRLKDRHKRDHCLGPTHEEVVTDLVRQVIHSYKQLPINLYQIQRKFRDEIRPRFGVMRSREFVMKDAYSFHLKQSCLEKTYQTMHDCYCRIFDRLGLNYKVIKADSGNIGGSVSHEFHVLSDTGEDLIVLNEVGTFAANIETIQFPEKQFPKLQNLQEKPHPTEKHTPNSKTIQELSQALNVSEKECIKVLIAKGKYEHTPLIALVLRGDHTLNETKAAKAIPDLHFPVIFAHEETLTQNGIASGFIGPTEDIGVPFYVDYSAAELTNFTCGANKPDTHIINVNWESDTPYQQMQRVDIRNAEEGDNAPDGSGKLIVKRGIEAGHIFQLGKKYSEAMHLKVLNEEGKDSTLTMGCYGIGVTRLVATVIEQSHDNDGIIWPESVAPFHIHCILLSNSSNSEAIESIAEELIEYCKKKNLTYLIDDRNIRAGVKLADADLIGIPHRFVIGARTLKSRCMEYFHRKTRQKQDVSLENLESFIWEL